MGREQTIATWSGFSVSAFCKAHGYGIKQFCALDARHRIVRFLAEHYDLLHYYDNRYVVSDIDRYLVERSGGSHAVG